uniref:Ketoacyl-synthetase C-terminal extension n=1 Tax=Candidatus Kentrum sp. TUN TaxID=2126343 RepID=A0A451AAP3_9GAMM|nr:MAG: Ketoacyl-synthetase C-terminal extension [Candidatus Kentron sp. TUN]
MGSVKTNIGHLEAAAGIAGFIKTVLALQYREIPPNLHLETLNPHLEMGNDIPLSIPTEPMLWPDGKRLAGVSSFGFSGTNAHVVLEEASAVGSGEPIRANPNEEDLSSDGVGIRAKRSPQSTAVTERPFHLLTLSAKNETALRELAGRYAAYLETHPEVSLIDVCFTANTGHAHFDHHLALVAGSSIKAGEQLRPTNYTTGKVRGERTKTAFLFTGQGSEYPDMGSFMRPNRFSARHWNIVMPSCVLWTCLCSICFIRPPPTRTSISSPT